ncbi:MAG: class II aldolase/adducin family protein [Chloroflexi bacterium]|nr:class II aldolase/adducin family protein [Chloroflexota bacterium]
MNEIEGLKEQLVAAVRMMVAEGLIDFNGHISARVPGTDHVLIHGRAISRRVVSAESFTTVDLDGNRLEGAHEPPSETPLHTCTYRARPDVMSVVHLHPHFSTLLGIARQPVVPVFTPGVIFGNGVPVLDDPSTVTTRELGDVVAARLGQGRALLLRGHGAVVVGESIPNTFVASVYLEENAKKQYQAALLGDIVSFSAADIEGVLPIAWCEKTVKKVWTYCESKARAEGYL